MKWPVAVVDEARWRGTPDADVAILYGREGNTPAILEAYRKAGRKAVYIDLGYWGRREGGRFTGYHKIAVNGHHPNAYLMRQAMPGDRLAKFGVEPKQWRPAITGRRQHILLAGMGDKGARAVGFEPEQWERETIAALRLVTDRPIVYRPKPSWKEAKPIEGVGFAHRLIPMETFLPDCWAVVTHHSNVAMEAVLAGIPAFCWDGVGALMASQDLSKIETPHYPSGRAQWAANIAYTQWNIEEMTRGEPWLHMQSAGLLP